MKLALIPVTAALVLALGLAGSVSALGSPQAGQCPDGGTKTDTSNGALVLPAGLTACIHAGNGNTGYFVTDGQSTLADYILASGLVNHGGQVPNVSNYVIYSEESTPCPTPTPTATPTDRPTPTPSPESNPTPTPTPSGSPSLAPTATPSAAPSLRVPENITPPPTAMAAGLEVGPTDSGFAAIIIILAFLAVLALTLRRSGTRSNWR